MTPPSLVIRTTEMITINWSPLVAPLNGNSAILSYDLFWDNALGSLTIELTDSLVTTYTVTGLTAGALYSFQVRARNIYGYG